MIMKTPLIGNFVVGRLSPSAPTLSRSYAKRSTLHALLGLAISLLGASPFAQSWQTVDDFQYVAGQPAENFGLVAAPSGVLFASGFGFDASGTSHGLVMASADSGNTWSAPINLAD